MAKDAPTTMYYKPFVPMNIITYEGSMKLKETTAKTETVGGIHINAFSGKSGQLTITSHTYENGVGTIKFNGDITIIGNGAFGECRSLTSITIPESVTSISNNAFYSCRGFTSIGDVGSGASVEIPNSVTSIGDSAFSNCTGLISVTIPKSVTSIDKNVFSYCGSLTSIVVDSANTVYDSRDNCNAIIKTSTNELIAGCKNTVIPNTVTSIGNSAFMNCTSLTNITIPNSVTSIGEYGFRYCTGLTSVTIPDSVTSIGNTAFRLCSGLTSVTIGSGVISISQYAFSSCTSLTSITCNATTAPSIEDDTFENVHTNGTLTVPSGSSGYDVWMGTGYYYLGKYNWTKVEQ